MLQPPGHAPADRKSTRLNSSHTVIYTLSLHDALPILCRGMIEGATRELGEIDWTQNPGEWDHVAASGPCAGRSEEHTSELQSHRDLHSFPTRRSSDLMPRHDRGRDAGTRRNRLDTKSWRVGSCCSLRAMRR